MKRHLARREFLKRTAQALATVAVCERMMPAGAQAATTVQSAGHLPMRTLGKTGLKLPLLGYGGAALPKAWRNPLSHEDRVALVLYAYDRGIRYFDTAGNYMESQTLLGEALKDRRRDVCLMSRGRSNPRDQKLGNGLYLSEGAWDTFRDVGQSCITDYVLRVTPWP